MNRHCSEVAKESRREGLSRCGYNVVREANNQLLRRRREILGDNRYYTAREIAAITGYNLQSTRSRLTEAVGFGELEESPERVKEPGYIACTAYRWKIKDAELPLDFGGVDKSA